MKNGLTLQLVAIAAIPSPVDGEFVVPPIQSCEALSRSSAE
jgi:hypothetical protein